MVEREQERERMKRGVRRCEERGSRSRLFGRRRLGEKNGDGNELFVLTISRTFRRLALSVQ